VPPVINPQEPELIREKWSRAIVQSLFGADSA